MVCTHADIEQCINATAPDAPGRALCSPAASNFATLVELQETNEAFALCKDGTATESGCLAAAEIFYTRWTGCVACGTFDYRMDQGQIECAQYVTFSSCGGVIVTGAVGAAGTPLAASPTPTPPAQAAVLPAAVTGSTVPAPSSPTNTLSSPIAATDGRSIDGAVLPCFAFLPSLAPSLSLDLNATLCADFGDKHDMLSVLPWVLV